MHSLSGVLAPRYLLILLAVLVLVLLMVFFLVHTHLGGNLWFLERTADFHDLVPAPALADFKEVIPTPA